MPELIVYIGYKIVSATIQKHQTCFFPHCFTWFYWDIVGWHFSSFNYQKNCRIERKKERKKGGKIVCWIYFQKLYILWILIIQEQKTLKKKWMCYLRPVILSPRDFGHSQLVPGWRQWIYPSTRLSSTRRILPTQSIHPPLFHTWSTRGLDPRPIPLR